jgi:peptide-methionine (S)-S-oxide reductase
MNTSRTRLRHASGALALALAAAFVWIDGGTGAQAAESVARIPPPAVDAPADASVKQETVVFAGGCFWGVQGVFQHTKGVLQAVSGYSGGKAETASYMVVSSGLTGHAESVQVTFDPHQVSYGKLLQIYFSVAHDPTQLNYQGPDHGSQYRSQIFYTNAAQKAVAEKYIAQLDAAKAYPKPIVTKIAPLAGFYPAEAYHQDYLTLHPTADYIATFDMPKIASLKTLFADQYRDKPVLVANAAKNS